MIFVVFEKVSPGYLNKYLRVEKPYQCFYEPNTGMNYQPCWHVPGKTDGFYVLSELGHIGRFDDSFNGSGHRAGWKWSFLDASEEVTEDKLRELL